MKFKKQKYEREIIERIKLDNDYVTRLFDYLILKTKDPRYKPKLRSNGDYTTKCIWHEEKTPSLRYSKQLKILKCFGCGRSCDIIGLYMYVFNTYFLKAVEIALEFKSMPNELVCDTMQLKIEFPQESE